MISTVEIASQNLKGKLLQPNKIMDMIISSIYAWVDG